MEKSYPKDILIIVTWTNISKFRVDFPRSLESFNRKMFSTVEKTQKIAAESHFSKATSFAPKNDEPLSFLHEFSPIITIPPEIFINICKDLPPKDLLSLAKTCRLFQEYLCNPKSTTSQYIWQKSRLTHIRFLQLPPPEGMTELKYCRLAIEKGCQVCGAPKIRKIYWEFQIRCCQSCLENLTISETDILAASEIYNSVISLVPSVKKGPQNVYWRSQVEEYAKEYRAIAENEKWVWVNQKTKILLKLNEDVCQRQEEERKERARKHEEYQRRYADRSNLIMTKIKEEINTQFNHNVFEKYEESIILDCSCFKKSCSENLRPLTQRCWQNFKKKFFLEYDEVALRKKQEEESRRTWQQAFIRDRRFVF
ncbi:hypothetical protein G9A89_010626 [Geosiphon pyriformis]|nr:hypothetical protein G9A89_010626 [Geosiphon pyriformis]